MYLLIELSPDLALTIEPPAPPWSELWDDTDCGEWAGFYDVLRASDRSPVGIRFWPFEEALERVSSIKESKRVFWSDQHKSLCILFGDRAEWEETISNDQLFIESRILSQGKKIGLLLSFYGLDERERAALSQAIQRDA
jgi:hypothetical protein